VEPRNPDNGSNEVKTFDLGTMTWTTNLPFSRWTENAKGLGHGSRRGICYDRADHCIWDSSGTGLWQGVGDLARGKWKYVADTARRWPRVAYDEGARKLICLGFGIDDRLHTEIY